MTSVIDFTDPDDILAFMLDNLRSFNPNIRTGPCANCYISCSPQWRSGWTIPNTKQKVDLCNACGLLYNKKNFCPGCNKVFRSADTFNSQIWAKCSKCERNVHKYCCKLVDDSLYCSLDCYNDVSHTSDE